MSFGASFSAIPSWFYITAIIFAVGFIIVSEWNSKSLGSFYLESPYFSMIIILHNIHIKKIIETIKL